MAPMVRSAHARECDRVVREGSECNHRGIETGPRVGFGDQLAAERDGQAPKACGPADVLIFLNRREDSDAAPFATVGVGQTNVTVLPANARCRARPIAAATRTRAAGGLLDAGSAGADTDQASRGIVESGTVDPVVDTAGIGIALVGGAGIAIVAADRVVNTA